MFSSQARYIFVVLICRSKSPCFSSMWRESSCSSSKLFWALKCFFQSLKFRPKKLIRNMFDDHINGTAYLARIWQHRKDINIKSLWLFWATAVLHLLIWGSQTLQKMLMFSTPSPGWHFSRCAAVFWGKKSSVMTTRASSHIGIVALIPLVLISHILSTCRLYLKLCLHL